MKSLLRRRRPQATYREVNPRPMRQPIFGRVPTYGVCGCTMERNPNCVSLSYAAMVAKARQLDEAPEDRVRYDPVDLLGVPEDTGVRWHGPLGVLDDLGTLPPWYGAACDLIIDNLLGGPDDSYRPLTDEDRDKLDEALKFWGIDPASDDAHAVRLVHKLKGCGVEVVFSDEVPTSRYETTKPGTITVNRPWFDSLTDRAKDFFIDHEALRARMMPSLLGNGDIK